MRKAETRLVQDDKNIGVGPDGYEYKAGPDLVATSADLQLLYTRPCSSNCLVLSPYLARGPEEIVASVSMRGAQMAGVMNSAVIVLFLALIAVEGISYASSSDFMTCPPSSKCGKSYTSSHVICPDSCPKIYTNSKQGKACYVDCKSSCTGICKCK